MRTTALRMFLLLALPAAFVGCSSRPKLAEVKGTVRLKGKPLAKVMVEFIPDRPNGPRATGTTNDDGEFTLICDDQRPGAMVGPNRVVLHDLDVYGDKFLGRKLELVGTPGGPTLKPSRIPDKYGSVAQTPLKKEVTAEPQTIDLDLTNP
jgi:hypothetical protein